MGLMVTSHDARAQPDYRHLVLHRGLLKSLEHLANRPVARVVGEWIARAARVQALHSMRGAAMKQHAMIFVEVIAHAVNTEETALAVEDVTEGPGVNLAGQD